MNGRRDVMPPVRAVPSVLVAAGIVGPIVFTVGFVAQDLLRGDYNPIAQQISELPAGPYGWVQNVNFVVFGLLMIAFAVGLHRGVRVAGTGVAGPAIVAWSGVGLVIAAAFPLREDAAGRIYDPIGVHSVNGAIFFWSIGVGLVVMSRRFARDANWRGLAAYALATGITLLVMAAIAGPLQRLEWVPLDPWAGLMQRAILAVWFPCVVILALRLRRVARASAAPVTMPRVAPDTRGGWRLLSSRHRGAPACGRSRSLGC